MDTLFDGQSPLVIVGVFAVYTAAYMIKGAFGFGQLSPAILASTLLLAPHHAVLLASGTSAVSQVQFIRQGWQEGDRQLAGQVVVSNVIGATVGIWIFGQIDSAALQVILGVSLGLVALADSLKLMVRLTRNIDVRSPLLAHSFSLVAGLVTGITGAGGFYLMAVYLKAATPDARSFRSTALLITAIIVLYRTMLLLLAGFFTIGIMIEVLLLIPAIVIGTRIGSAIFGRMNAASFYRALQIFIFTCASLVVLDAVI